MTRSVRRLHAISEALALAAIMATIVGFALVGANSAKDFFRTGERSSLSRSALFLRNQLADRLELFSSYAEDAFRGLELSAPVDMSVGLIVDARALTVLKVLPGRRSGVFFDGYDLSSSVPGMLLSGMADKERMHSGVIRSPEWDGPAIYYAARDGDRIVVSISGIDSVARVLARVSEVASGGYVFTSMDGFPFVNSVPGAPSVLMPSEAAGDMRRLGEWYVSALVVPELGGILHKFTPAREIDDVFSVILFSILPVGILLVLFAFGKYFVEYRIIVRPVEMLAEDLSGWPDRDLKDPGDMSAEIGALYGSFRQAGERTLSALASLATAKAELASANVELEERVAARTAELAVANEELARSNEGLNGALEAITRVQDKLVLQEKMAALGRLAAGVAHELNTPLGAIVSAATKSTGFGEGSIVRCVSDIRDLSDGEIELFLSLLRIAGAATISPEAIRIRAAGLRTVLADRGAGEARRLAMLMAEIGLEEMHPEARALAANPDGERIIALVDMVTSSSRSLELVRMAAGNASRVVAALRSYSWESSGAEPTPVRLDRQIADVLLLMRDKLKEGLEIKVEVPQDLVVLADQDKLVQVWINLINNAIQAMDDSGILEIVGERDGASVRLSIADDGTGIPEDIQDHVFDPFFTTKPQGEGTGLGLDICKRLVGMAGGTIRFESRPGRTVFIVELPALDPAGEADR